MAHRTEEVSRKFAFRNPADAADATYENVVRGRGGETKRTSAGSDDVRCGEGNCLFYGVEAKTYDIVPGKVAGSYFRDPVSFPSIPLHVPFFLFPLAHTLRRSFSANGINFRPRSTTQ